MSLFLALFSLSAHASTTSGYVTEILQAASSYSEACMVEISSSSSATSGTWFYVDDVAGEWPVTCQFAALAMYTNDYVTVNYSYSSSKNWIEGLASSESGNIPTFYTHDSTGTSSADMCLATMSSSGGTVSAYVDDTTYPEGPAMCMLLAFGHVHNSASWTVNRSSSVVTTLQIAY